MTSATLGGGGGILRGCGVTGIGASVCGAGVVGADVVGSCMVAGGAVGAAGGSPVGGAGCCALPVDTERQRRPRHNKPVNELFTNASWVLDLYFYFASNHGLSAENTGCGSPVTGVENRPGGHLVGQVGNLQAGCQPAVAPELR